jgi:hypothetical protein
MWLPPCAAVPDVEGVALALFLDFRVVALTMLYSPDFLVSPSLEVLIFQKL